MTTAFDKLQRAQFGLVQFAWDDLSITSDYRVHVHTYRRTAGGRIEKHGRGLYTFNFSCIFDEALNRTTLANGNEGYPGSYPKGLQTLQDFYETGISQDLTVPTMGTLVCMTQKFSRRATLPLRSGERVSLEFIEDMEEDFKIQALVTSNATNDVASSSEKLKVEVKAKNFEENIWDNITKAVDQLLAIRDQANLASDLISAKAFALASICDEADRTVKGLQDPTNHGVLEALKELTFSAQRLAIDSRDSVSSPIQVYTLTSQLTIQEVSQRIYNVTSRAFDLLQLNHFLDALRIPAGTHVRYYADL